MRLALHPLLAIGVASAAPAGAANVDGAWGDGCYFGYAIVTKRGNVCGTWTYLATNRQYGGLFTGTSTANGFIAKRVCGTPGGFAKSYCPDEDSLGLEPAGWVSIRAPARVCHGRLIFLDDGETLPDKCGQIEVWALRGRTLAMRKGSKSTWPPRFSAIRRSRNAGRPFDEHAADRLRVSAANGSGAPRPGRSNSRSQRSLPPLGPRRQHVQLVNAGRAGAIGVPAAR